jgi:hypothetical protein
MTKFAIGMLAVTGLAGCGSGDDTSDTPPLACTRGDQSACMCPSGSRGQQACVDAGTFGPCDCASGAGGSIANGGVGGASGAGGSNSGAGGNLIGGAGRNGTGGSAANGGGGVGGAKGGAGGTAPGDSGVTPGGPLNPSAWMLRGKGLWIWYFAYTGLTAAESAQKAQAAGVGYVLIKSGQDASFWSTRYTAAAVNEFTSRGMHVLAWPYVTPADVPGSIAAAVRAANVPGTDGLVLDVEVEWEGGVHDAAAKQLCEGIRAGKSGAWLAYTSFGWVGYHSGLPFKTFDTYCGDAYFPQVYWSDRGVTWSFGYQQAIDQLSAAGLKAPNWLIESNDDVNGTSSGPVTADLNAFFDKAGTRSSLWEFPEASRSEKLAQLVDLHFRNP